MLWVDSDGQLLSFQYMQATIISDKEQKTLLVMKFLSPHERQHWCNMMILVTTLKQVVRSEGPYLNPANQPLCMSACVLF